MVCARWYQRCQKICGTVALWLLGAWIVGVSPVRGDWPMHRGNAARTGTTDLQPGPQKPKVLWVHKTREHFVAAAVPGKSEIYLSSLGAFNTARFDAFSQEASASKRIVWSKSAQSLKLPTVCAPAVVGNRLVFGDGMHQTDGAVLHCLSTEGGLPVWQLPVPGKLVHLEGGPAVAEGKVYIGGGNAGVLCVDMQRVTLEGKEQPLEVVQATIAKKWKELQEKYEIEKKKDPDFAVAPSDDALPRPQPVVLWQQGKDKWHVDAPVNVAGKLVLAASAFLDEEKLGDRTLYALHAADGSVAWKTPLKLNPWAGPTVAGETVFVGTSSIRFDPKLIRFGQGEVVAVELGTGTVKWRKSIKGGVVSAIAVRDGIAVFTATDGKLRGWDAQTGAEKWVYEAGGAYFAGPAVSPKTVFTADLKGVVHAVNLADGQPVWKLDLAQDPAVKAGGMVYGSPLLANGKLYVATCNLESAAGVNQTAVVCIGE